MGNPNTFTAIKAHVGGTATDPARLYQAEHQGVMWASNGYWVTPAERVAPLLQRFNLNPHAPGAFDVNGTVHLSERSNAEVVLERFGESLPERLDPAAYTVPLTAVMVAGSQAYMRPSDRGSYRAVYQSADGAFLALDPGDLEWLNATYNITKPEDCYYGQVRYLVAGPGIGTRAVGIVADLIRRVSPVSHGTGPDGEPTTSGGETENLGPRVVGVIGSLKMEAGK
jgi:hypothetical protein